MNDRINPIDTVPDRRLSVIEEAGDEASQHETEVMARELREARSVMRSILTSQPIGHKVDRALRRYPPICLCRWCKAHRIAARAGEG